MRKVVGNVKREGRKSGNPHHGAAAREALEAHALIKYLYQRFSCWQWLSQEFPQ